MEGDQENNFEGSVGVLRKFIETYEGLPVLWNPTDSNYMNKPKRNTALDQLCSIYVKIKPGATRSDVRRKINTLRSNYRKELKKISESMKSGAGLDNLYQPTSWVFYALQFLNKFEQPESYNDQQTEQSHNYDGTRETELDSSRSSIIYTPPPAKQIKKEHDLHPIPRYNKFKKTCSYLEISMPHKEIPVIAVAWGEKLDSLEAQQRSLAEKAINDILFEASEGTLHRHSVRINSPQGGILNSYSSVCRSGVSTSSMPPVITEGSGPLTVADPGLPTAGGEKGRPEEYKDSSG